MYVTISFYFVKIYKVYCANLRSNNWIIYNLPKAYIYIYIYFFVIAAYVFKAALQYQIGPMYIQYHVVNVVWQSLKPHYIIVIKENRPLIHIAKKINCTCNMGWAAFEVKREF